MAEMRAMVARYAEACFLLRTLGEHNVGRLAARLDEPTRERVRRLTLRQLACDPEGDALASQLISALISEHLASQVTSWLNPSCVLGSITGSSTLYHVHEASKPSDSKLISWSSRHLAAMLATSAPVIVILNPRHLDRSTVHAMLHG